MEQNELMDQLKLLLEDKKEVKTEKFKPSKPDFTGFIRVAGWKGIDEKTGKEIIRCRVNDRFTLHME